MSARRVNSERSERRGRRAEGRGDTRARLLAVVAGLLAVHFLLAVTSVWNKSVTYDELAHLTRGVSYFKTGDYRLGPPHPPLAHYIGALGALSVAPHFPTLAQGAWKKSDVWSMGMQFFYGLHNPTDQMLFRGRCMIALLSTGLGLLVFLWARAIFGTAGGVLALLLYAFDPTMLAHGSLVTTDLVSAAFFTASIAALWQVSHRVSAWTVAAAVVAVAGMFLAKGSGVLMAFMGLLIIIVRVLAPRPMVFALWGQPRELRGPVQRAAVLAGLVLLLVVTTDVALWAGFGFRWSPFRDGADTPAGYEREAVARERDYFTAGTIPPRQSAWDYQMRGLGKNAEFCHWIHEHKLLPDAYVYGFLAMLQSERGRDSFLNGERTLFGSRWFFPYAFMVKTPLPLFAMLIAAAAAGITGLAVKLRPNKEGAGAKDRDEADDGGSGWRGAYGCIPLAILLGVYAAVSMRSTLNIGHRHLLPLYPAMLILCGAAAGWWSAAGRAGRYGLGALAGLAVLASLSSFPNYLAYFNWIVGGPSQGYKHLVDSSLDWGQDLPALAAKLKSEYAGKPVYLQYFGRGSPQYEGIRGFRTLKTMLPGDGRGELKLRGGVYCISATSFQQLYVLDTEDIRKVEGAEAGARLRPGGSGELPLEWTAKYEAFYQRMLPTMQRLEALPDDSGQRLALLRGWRPDYAEAYYLFTKLRFMRMCAFLRQREPDSMAGYSILMFNLSDDDVRRMTEGPPPESKPRD